MLCNVRNLECKSYMLCNVRDLGKCKSMLDTMYKMSLRFLCIASTQVMQLFTNVAVFGRCLLYKIVYFQHPSFYAFLINTYSVR